MDFSLERKLAGEGGLGAETSAEPANVKKMRHFWAFTAVPGRIPFQS
jgi:hypothetical protein